MKKILPAIFVDGIRKFRIEGTSLKMNLALRGLPDFKALPGPGPQHGATMHICPSVEYIERAWDDAKYGRPSQWPLIEMTIPTMYDTSLAPEGHHIMGIFLQYAPYTLKGTTWEQEREPYSQRILDVIEEYCPNIRDIIVERQTLSPWDLEQRFGIAGGNIFHGEMSLDQMFVMRPLAGSARYRTPLKGLYLCGSGAHPGGGVMGAPGHNCAREILKGYVELRSCGARADTAWRCTSPLLQAPLAYCHASESPARYSLTARSRWLVMSKILPRYKCDQTSTHEGSKSPPSASLNRLAASCRLFWRKYTSATR